MIVLYARPFTQHIGIRDVDPNKTIFQIILLILMRYNKEKCGIYMNKVGSKKQRRKDAHDHTIKLCLTIVLR